jgi:hypothetical protein
VERGVVAIVSAVRVDLLQDEVETVGPIVEEVDDVGIVPSVPLDARAGVADLETRDIGRRERMKRRVIGVAHAGAGIRVELGQNPFEVVVEVLHAVEDETLEVACDLGLVVIGIADIRRDRPKGRVVGVGDAGVRVELREDRVEAVDRLFDQVIEVVQVEARALEALERFECHVFLLSMLSGAPRPVRGEGSGSGVS